MHNSRIKMKDCLQKLNSEQKASVEARDNTVCKCKAPSLSKPDLSIMPWASRNQSQLFRHCGNWPGRPSSHPTMHEISHNATCNISVTKLCIVGYEDGASWVLSNRSTLNTIFFCGVTELQYTKAQNAYQRMLNRETNLLVDLVCGSPQDTPVLSRICYMGETGDAACIWLCQEESSGQYRET